jgi:hypothetical protein
MQGVGTNLGTIDNRPAPDRFGAVGTEIRMNPKPSSQDGDRLGDAGLFVMIPLQILHDGSLSHAAKLVYGRLRLFAGRDGRCYPSQETLAREVCLHERELRNLLSELRAAGWINWHQTRSTCVYTVLLDRQRIAD